METKHHHTGIFSKIFYINNVDVDSYPGYFPHLLGSGRAI